LFEILYYITIYEKNKNVVKYCLYKVVLFSFYKIFSDESWLISR